MKTIFEKIIAREIPSEIIREDDLLIVIKDIFPVAPKHFLAIPKKHIINIQDLKKTDALLIGHIFLTIQKVAEQEKLAAEGYRVVTNIGEYGGQSVNHLHFHILGGRVLQWPPG